MSNSLVIVLITIALLLKFLQTWMQGPKCLSKRRLDGKVVVITGANTGIGKECAKEMSRRGAKVIMLVRSLARGEAAAREIRGDGREIIVEKMDLSSFNSIRECASKLNVILDKLIFSSIMLEKWHALYQEQKTDLRCRKEKIILGISYSSIYSFRYCERRPRHSGKQFIEFEQLTNSSKLNHQIIRVQFYFYYLQVI